MAGRQPRKIHVYKPDGSVVKKYLSIADFARDNRLETNYVSNNQSGRETGMLKNGNVYSTKAIGRLAVKHFVRVQNSPYVAKRRINSHDLVHVYNLEDEHIMTFKNDFIARTVFPTLSYGRSGNRTAGLRFEKVDAEQ